MFERFTDNARRAVRAARRPGKRPLAEVHAHDLLHALAEEPRGLAPWLLARAGVDLESLKAELATSEVAPGPGGREWFERARQEARRRGDNYVGTEHLLLAVAQLPANRAREALATHGVTPERLEALLTEADAEWRRRHPPLARRIGAAVRITLRRLRGRS